GDRVEVDFCSQLRAPLVVGVVVTCRCGDDAPTLRITQYAFDVRVELGGGAFNSSKRSRQAVAGIESVRDDASASVAAVAAIATPDAAIVQAAESAVVVRGVGLT